MANHITTLDLITIGRAGVDLYGQQIGGRLEDMASFAKYIGGCPTNIAAGTARLGLKSALLSRVGDDHFGRFIREELERCGVVTTAVKTDPERLTALAFLGVQDQETFPLVFYRENCADMALSEDDIDPDFIRSARAVVLTGTHFSSETTRKACWKTAEIARAADRKVILDIDYRPVLWGLAPKAMGEDRFVADETVSGELQNFIPLCDLIVGTEEEFHIAGKSEDTLEALRTVRSMTDATLVLKIGEQGCLIFDDAIPKRLQDGIHAPGFPIEVFNVLGAGDAFMSGFLKGWLEGKPLEECGRLGNAAGALVVSRHGCAPASPTWRELEYFLLTGVTRPDLRNDAELELLHRVSTRTGHYDQLTVFAIDHRSQFVDMAKETGADLAKIDQFKLLALEAMDAIAGEDPSFGILLDDTFGMRALEKLADKPYWIGRPIEVPGSKPVAFEGDADVGCTLREWPSNHVVKCLVNYHPADAADVREAQERQVARLYDACKRTGHELLLEIICSNKEGNEVHDDTVAIVLSRFADLGIFPDWWKLEPAKNVNEWEKISEALQARHRHARGVVILGLSAPIGELKQSFEICTRYPAVKGFAVGRTLFEEPAKAWLADKIDDDQALAMMKFNFAKLLEAWRGCKETQTA